MKSLKQELEDRGFLNQYTNDKVFSLFDSWKQKFYFWVDCSAPSMTIWNFVALMMAVHFMLAWNKCYLLVWWATSTIWNPSWKDKERPILPERQLSFNQKEIWEQFDRLVKNVEMTTGKKLEYEIINNYDFYKNMNILDFLKEVWKFMTVNWMISKDIVRKRINDPDKWISYAEFSYMLVMGYDYYYLFKNNWVILEVGGSDEWDWILSGIELISKKEHKEVYWVTNKLIVDSNWKKFGKSEWNAIWLDSKKTSSYEMYQYFINTLDEDVDRYLKLFSFLSIDEINKIIENHMKSPEKRKGQKLLAYNVVKIIHGEKDARNSNNISDLIFWWRNTDYILQTSSKGDMMNMYNELWGFKYNSENLFETIVKSGLANSNSEARNAIQSGAIYINERKLYKNEFNFEFNNFFINWFMFIRKWKNNFKLVIKK